MNAITRFVNDDQGADLIEYALLVGLITLAAVTALGTLGENVKLMWEKISTDLSAKMPK